MEPTTDVIITCHEYGRFLEEAVDSVLAQTRSEYRIIVVDDGSEDPETLEILDRFDRPRTLLLRQENQGVSAARNRGIREGEGEYVVCLDADDRLHPQFLEKTAHVLEADSGGDVGFVAPWLRKFGQEDEIWRSSPFDPVLIGYLCCVPVSSLFRRSAWEAVGGYPEEIELAEDWSFWIAVVAAGYRWEVVEEVLYDYRQHGGNKARRTHQHREEVFERLVVANPDYYARYRDRILAELYSRFRSLDDVWHDKACALEENETLARQLRASRRNLETAREEIRELEEAYRSLELDNRALSKQAHLRNRALADLERHHEVSGAGDVDRLWEERETFRKSFEALEEEYRRLEQSVKGREGDPAPPTEDDA